VQKNIQVLKGLPQSQLVPVMNYISVLLRRSGNVTTMIGVIPEQVDFEDYRDAGGIKLPFTIRISSIDSFFSSTRRFSEIKVNVPVDQTKFSKPAGPPLASPRP
jgi:hypothetical protein